LIDIANGVPHGDGTDLEIATAIGVVPAWAYREIQLDGALVGEIVEIPNETARDIPPTNAETLLIRAWNA